MNINSRYHLPFTGLVIALLLFISACGTDDSSPESESKEQTDVVVNSEMGEVSIPTDVERVIAPFHEDALLALSVTPVAKWAIGQSIQDYLEKDLQDIPKIEWNLPLEKVLALNPELIILENNLESYEGTYEDYNKIAPTYVMTKDTTESWRNQIDTFGEILGKEDQAKKVLTSYEEKVSDAKEELEKAIGNETVAAIWAIGGEFFLFEQYRHSAEVLYSELGISSPALVTKISESRQQWNPISIEKLSELEADHVFLLAAEGEQGIELLENSSVWQSIPAVEKGNIYMIEDPSNWTNKGLNASQQTIEDVIGALVD